MAFDSKRYATYAGIVVLMPAWKIYWGRVYENKPIMTSYTDSP
jgi:hypothetical protein